MTILVISPDIAKRAGIGTYVTTKFKREIRSFSNVFFNHLCALTILRLKQIDRLVIENVRQIGSVRSAPLLKQTIVAIAVGKNNNSPFLSYFVNQFRNVFCRQCKNAVGRSVGDAPTF